MNSSDCMLIWLQKNWIGCNFGFISRGLMLVWNKTNLHWIQPELNFRHYMLIQIEINLNWFQLQIHFSRIECWFELKPIYVKFNVDRLQFQIQCLRVECLCDLKITLTWIQLDFFSPGLNVDSNLHQFTLNLTQEWNVF